MTMPLVWFLHEEPHDFYRYTPHGLRYLVTSAGFTDVEITPTTDAFSSVAQLVSELNWMMGRSPDGRDDERNIAAHAMIVLSQMIGSFDHLDSKWIFPLNYALTARKSEQTAHPTAVPDQP
jgi:hypothetical protein